MLFGGNRLTLTHEATGTQVCACTGSHQSHALHGLGDATQIGAQPEALNARRLQIVFSALDALRAWRERPLPPVVVQSAEAWKASRSEAIATAQAVQLSYDWCASAAC